MTDPTFTILLPVHRPPAMLPFAINSVLAQERRDFELFVICDGAPPETASCAQEFAARDSRIHVFVHPKGEGKGEAYRHQALRQARGSYVCQIGDDDLWLPNHLSEIALLLRDVDFGNLSHIEALVDGRVILLSGDASDPAIRQRMTSELFNFFGQTVWGYRLSAYRSLPLGWSPAPLGLPSDINMIRKFFAQEGLRFGTRVGVTTVKFAAYYRRAWSLEQRAAEVKEWVARVADPAGRDAIVQMGLGDMNRRAYALQVGSAVLHGQVNSLQAQNAELRAQYAQLQAKPTAQAGEKDAATASAAVQAELQQHLRGRAHQVKKLRHRITAIKRTWSWRLTRPLRRLARALGR